MNAVAIIQARMTSSRLPGKVMADIAGKPALEQMISRVRRASRLSGVTVATTANPADDKVAELADRLGIGLFRGEEADVLGRLYAAALVAKADPVVRLTADCPLADPAVIDAALALYETSGADYVSNCNRRTFPDGCDVEVFSAAALETAHREARHPELREHVTPYIRGSRPDLGAGQFRRVDLLADADFGHIRFTVDTAEDLALMRLVFERLPENFGWLDAVAIVTRDPSALRVTEPPPMLRGLAMRPAVREDAATLFRWLNAPDRRATSFATAGPVRWSDHVAWLDRQLSAPDRVLELAVYDGLAAGQVRSDRVGDEVIVSIYVDAAFRGRGVGRMMMDRIVSVVHGRWPDFPIVAHVRSDNPGSIAFFRSIGFVPAGSAAGRTILKRPGARKTA